MPNNTQYMVGVCITTYNMQDYIARAIDGVLMQQTSFDYEIVVSDDASTDNTLEILEQYRIKAGEERFKIITSEKNQGVTPNLAKSLFATNAKYIALLDADDYWIDDKKLQKQVDYLQSNPDVGYVYTNYYHESITAGKRLPAFPANYLHPVSNAYEMMLIQHYIQPSNTCFRASLIDKQLVETFIQRNFKILDYCLFLDFALKTKGAYLPFATTVYSHRPGSMSRENNYEKALINYFHSYEIGNFFMNENPLPDALQQKRDFDYHYNLFLAAWKYGSFEDVQLQAVWFNAMLFKKHNPRALYVYYASKQKWLYFLVRPWLLRKRKFGK